jgi:DNA-binding CsgD family transcriptional regulator
VVAHEGGPASTLRASIIGLPLVLAALADDDLPAAAQRVAKTRGLLPDEEMSLQPLGTGLFHGVAAVVQAADAAGPFVHCPDPALLDETIVSSSFRVAHAIAAGRTGDSARATALFAEADAGLAGASWLRAVYRRYTAESALSDGWGEPGVWLADAERYFDAIGRETLARACRSLLRLAGKSPRRTPSNLYGGGYADLELTTREGDVLALLAGGLTNKQIAARLYLSPRTVEKHVERILTKTGQGNRTALAAYAAGRRSGGGAPGEHTGRRDRSHVDPDVRPALTSRP